MSTDKETTVQRIKSMIDNFINARHWKKYHNPKNLSEAIIVEAGELMELFLFKDAKESQKLAMEDPELRERIAEELADVLIYSYELANHLNFDITEIIEEKMKKNAEKYPLSK